MKIKLMSDLHSEFWHPNRGQVPAHLLENSQKADVIILAGDIEVGMLKTANVLHQFAEVYQKVVYLPGNHEFYGSNIHEMDDLRMWVPENVYVLNPGVVKINDVTFIGAPLWTNFRGGHPGAKQSAKQCISDFRQIRDFGPEVCEALFNEHATFIHEVYNATPGKKVIVTHFLPAIECIDKQYQNEGLLNYYFANDMASWISTLEDTTWCFGHTHESVDIKINNTRLLCNPYGYNGENKKFTNMIFEI